MIDLSKVFPRIKAAFSDKKNSKHVVKGDGREITLSHDDLPVLKVFIEGLKVAYAIDEGTHFKFVQNRDLTDDLTLEILHKAAMDNMIKEISENLQINGDPTHGVMITNGGNYEATMLLVDGLWHQMQEIMNSEFYVAVPARDLLYVAPKSNPDALELLTSTINNFFEDEDTQGALVKHIYERDNIKNTCKLVLSI